MQGSVSSAADRGTACSVSFPDSLAYIERDREPLPWRRRMLCVGGARHTSRSICGTNWAHFAEASTWVSGCVSPAVH